jgi:hypothetical protein
MPLLTGDTLINHLEGIPGYVPLRHEILLAYRHSIMHNTLELV